MNTPATNLVEKTTAKPAKPLRVVIKNSVRPLLRRTLPPGAFNVVRIWWWKLSYYFPCLIASVVVKRHPKVRGSANAAGFVAQIQNVNTLVPTKMCRVMTKYGSDKSNGWHNYTTIYSALLKTKVNEPLRILEVGLGTNNPNLPSTMGSEGRPGASLRGWRELFPKALVYGADIDRAVLFQDDRIKTFYCDQLDQTAIREMWAQPDLKGGMDVIIEDGLHTFEANVSFLAGSLEQLRPGGLYVVEDITNDVIEKWYQQIETVYSRQYPDFEFAFTILPNPANQYDNNLLVIRRRQN